jgi:prevent-host-death family protein
MPNIKSSTDLRNNYNDISTFCHESNEPIFITKNGRGDLVVMSIQSYEAIKEITSSKALLLKITTL